MNPRFLLLVVSGATLLVLTACGTEPPAASGTPPASGSAASGSAASGPARSGSAAPASATTAASANSAGARPSRAGDGCPVTAAALQKVVRLPAGWRIEASSIECSHGWAQAGVTAPTPEQQGDGVVLFAYDAATGAWVDKGQGSSVDCAAFGIPKKAGRALSVCFYPN